MGVVQNWVEFSPDVEILVTSKSNWRWFIWLMREKYILICQFFLKKQCIILILQRVGWAPDPALPHCKGLVVTFEFVVKLILGSTASPLNAFPDTGGLEDIIGCDLAYALLASFSLLLLCLGATLGISSLLLLARRFPKLGIASYFKALPADFVPRPPCNSPTLSRNRRRKMKPLRPLLPADGHPRPIARVAAYSNLREGVVFKHPRQHQGSASRAVTLAQVHHAGPAARGSIPPRGPLAGTYV